MKRKICLEILLNAIGESGIWITVYPEEHELNELSMIKLVIVIEEVARVDPRSALVIEVESLFNQTNR